MATASPQSNEEQPQQVFAQQNMASNTKEEQLLRATQNMFGSISEYIKGELEVTNEDLTLLEDMNKITKEKYVGMTKVVENMNAYMSDLQRKYQELDPYLKKIEQIDGNITELEGTVSLLDEYTKRLEDKFKKLAQQKKEAAKRR